MKRFLDQILAQIRAFNPTPRERAGITLIALALGAVLLFSGVDAAMTNSDAARTAREERVNAEADYRRLSNHAAQEQVGLAAGKIWQWSIVDVTESIAQVRAITELQNVTSIAGVTNPGVEPVGGSVGHRGPSGLNTFDFVVSGDFNWQTFIGLMSALESSQISILPIGLDVSPSTGGGQRFALTVRLSYLPQDNP